MNQRVEKQVERIRNLLRDKIREQGYNQHRVESAHGWGGSYVSRILKKNHNIRYKQILLILTAIGIPPGDFFAEVFFGDRPFQPAEPDPRGLAQLLIQKGLLTPADVSHLTGPPPAKPSIRSRRR